MSNSTIHLRVLSGWGVLPSVLQGWLQSLPPHYDVQLLDMPDLAEQRLLSAQERSQKLLEGQPADAYWIGWSLGGAIVLDLAAQAADQVRGVITLATNPCFVAQVDWPGMDAGVFENFLQAYRDNPSKTLQRFAGLQVDGAQNPRAQLRELKSQLLEPTPVLADLLGLLAEDRRQLLQDIELPVLSLLATSDALVPASAAQKLAALNPKIRSEIICGASHLLFQDQLDTLRDSVVNWIEQQEMSYAR